jgi:hypothetical protein
MDKKELEIKLRQLVIEAFKAQSSIDVQNPGFSEIDTLIKDMNDKISEICDWVMSDKAIMNITIPGNQTDFITSAYNTKMESIFIPCKTN